MKLARTLNDIQLLKSTPPQKISWNEALAIMLDVMQDIREESFSDLSAMEFDTEALAKWRTLANTLLNVPMEDAARTMPERSKARLDSYREKMEDYSSKANSAENELRQLEKAEDELKQQIAGYEKLKEQLEEQNQKATQLRMKIDILKQDIENIKDVDPEMLEKTKEDLQLEKERRAVRSEDYKMYSEQLADAVKEREKLDGDIAKAQDELLEKRRKVQEAEEALREKQKELAQIEQSCNTLSGEIEKLDAAISEKKSSSKELIDLKLAKEVELKKHDKEREQTQQDIDILAQQIRAAHGKAEELTNLNAERRRELDSITDQIAELEQQSPNLEKQLEERRADLEERSAKQNAEVQEIQQQLNDLNRQIREANDRCGEILSEKHAAEDQLEKTVRKTEEEEAEIGRLKKEAATVEERRLVLNNKKSELLKKRARYEADIEEYKKFFDSEECRKNQQVIDRLYIVIKEYQNAIDILFHPGSTVYVEQLAGLNDSYQQMKIKLAREMQDIWNRYKNLSTGYLNVVNEIEERIRL